MLEKTILIRKGLEADRTGYTPETAELMFTTDKKELWVGDGITPGGIRVDSTLENTIIVSTVNGDFNSVKEACDSITDSSETNKYSILVHAGVYYEQPFIIPDFVKVTGFNCKIFASNANSPLISLSNGSHLKSVRLSGPGASSCIYSNTTANSIPIVDDVVIESGFVGVQADGPNVAILIEECKSSTQLSTMLYSTNYGRLNAFNILSMADTLSISYGGFTVLKNCVAEGSNKGIVVDNGGVTQVSSITMNNVDTCMEIGTAGSYSVITGSGVSCLGNRTLDLNQLSLTGIVRLSGGLMTTEKFECQNWDLINVDYNSDSSINDSGFNIIKELKVGTAEIGKESSFGEGDSYIRGMKIYSYDGATYTEVQDNLTKSFPNTNIDSAIYIASTLENGDFLKFFGNKINTTVAAVLGAGEIVSEYYNGTSWVEFNTMSTQSADKYMPYANSLFERVENEHIRFDNAIQTDWQKSDDMSLGTSYYWMRYRIKTAITTSPTFTTIKLHTNRTEINEDGWIEYFGKARPLARLGWDYNLTQPAVDSPGNRDVYLSDNLFVGRLENRFVAGARDQQGMSFRLPFDIDTSCPIKIVMSFVPEDAQTGDIEFNFRWNNTSDNTNVFISTGSAPATSINEKSVIVQTSINSSERYTQQTFEVELDISDMVSRREVGYGDILWVSFERHAGNGGDTYNGDIAVINMDAHYVKWCNGGHI